VQYVLPYEDAEGVALSPLTFLSTVLRHRVRVAIWILGCGAGAGLITLLLRGYRAESSFAPQTNQSSISSLAGLASQFGFNVGSLTGGPSLDFYASVATSRTILSEAATTVYRFPSDADGPDSMQGTLIEVLRVRGDTPVERLQRTVKKLEHMLTVTKDEDAGIVTIDVKAKWPALAEQVNRRILSLVNEVNLSQHQAQAAAEGAFVVARLGEMRAQLDSAEDALRRFFEENRTYQDSPRLTVEQGRLQRQVDFLQQVYLTLAQAYERARIEEARNTPVITIIDAPEGSGKKSGSLILSVVIGLILGGMLGLVHGLGKDYMNGQRVAESAAYREFASLRATALRELRALPRGIVTAARLRRRS